MHRPDHHNEVELNFLGAGSVTYLLGGRKISIEPGRLSVFWAAIPHQIIECAGETSYHVVTIPLPWFLQWRLPDHLVQPLLQGRMISEPNADRAKFDADLFALWEENLAGPDRQLEGAALLEMQARLVRLAANTPATRTSGDESRHRAAVSEDGLNKVERMACFIAQHYTEPLTVSRISEAVRLHPNYAMNLFQKSFGITLIDYLTQHRVSHAQRLLATTVMKIATVAYESGFSSISRFNEAFQRACNCPPREYRRTHLISEALVPAGRSGLT